MTNVPTPPSAPSACRPPHWVRAGLGRALRLLLLGLFLAVFYEWGVTRFHPRSGPAGFGHGALHGALMPMALPALLVGRDVPIYAERNTGRSYKLGYIAGINVCGFVVFGSLFLTPRPRAAPPATQ